MARKFTQKQVAAIAKKGGKFPPTCEKIIQGVKRSNLSRPKSKQVNPFAIAQSNPKCNEDFKKKHLRS